MAITLEITCPFCGAVSFVDVDEEAFIRWQSGELIQNAFPYMRADDREILISGLCYDCQADFFSEEEEEEPDFDDDYDYDFGYDPYLGYCTYDC